MTHLHHDQGPRFFVLSRVMLMTLAAISAASCVESSTTENAPTQTERPTTGSELPAPGSESPSVPGSPGSPDASGVPEAASDPETPGGGDNNPSTPTTPLLEKLGLPSRFAIGLGNDVTAAENWDANKAHAWGLGQKLDIHYMYLSGFEWPTWNSPEGAYITIHVQAAKSRGVIPMFTLYQAAAEGENKIGNFSDTTFMTKYWRGVRVMFTRLGELDSPSIVHVEPDLWGYFQQRGSLPSASGVKVGSLVPECAGLPEDASGFGKCIVRLGRQLAPKAAIGLSASAFGAYTNGKSDPTKVADYLNLVGASESDLMVVETLDRDAGCFEKGVDPNCKRSGKFYWNDSDFRAHLAWAKTIHERTGKMLLWWQMPLGVPSNEFGTASSYRDNRVQWLFAHPSEFVDAGGFGAVFGTGAPNQTTVKTDNGQFRTAITQYFQAPATL
jgi:hypothetical protein